MNTNFTLEELIDLQFAVKFDRTGTYGDERSKRLDKLDAKMAGIVNRAKKEEVNK
jgi:hypothetical protein